MSDAHEPVDELAATPAVGVEESEPADNGAGNSLANTSLQSDQPDLDASDMAANAPAELLTSLGGEGTLASFAADNAQGNHVPDASQHTGQATGAVWDVQFRGEPTVGMLRSIDGARLAAVRQRRGFIEVALIRDSGISSPTNLGDLLRSHPEYSARKGIVLDRRWLADVEDRLLTYGGGWHAWLLIEDGVFDEWLAVVDRRIAARGLDWESVERIEAVVQVRPVDARVQADFTVLRVHTAQDSPDQASREADRGELINQQQ